MRRETRYELCSQRVGVFYQVHKHRKKDSFKSGLLPVDFHLCIVLHTFHQTQI